MKRTAIILSLIFALATAVSVSIPTLAATSGTTPVTGSLAAKIDVVAPSALATLTLDPAASPATGTATNGSVKCNHDNWTVTVTSAPVSGQLTSNGSPSDYLSAVLQVNIGNGGGLVNITNNPTLTGVSRTAGTPIQLSVSQAVGWTDVPHTDYYLVITFAGTYEHQKPRQREAGRTLASRFTALSYKVYIFSLTLELIQNITIPIEMV